jgi:hypothetical protein
MDRDRRNRVLPALRPFLLFLSFAAGSCGKTGSLTDVGPTPGGGDLAASCLEDPGI